MGKPEVWDAVLKPMKAVFARPPHTTEKDETTALNEYAEALQSFSETDLRSAWAEVRDANTKVWWPAIGLLVKAAAESRQRRNPTTETGSRNAKVQGRMVDGVFMSWSDCHCPRCVRQEEFRREEERKRWNVSRETTGSPA